MLTTATTASNEIVEKIDPKYKKRIYQFIGFNEEEIKNFVAAFQPNKSLFINDKFHVDVEKHDTFELIKLRKHKAREHE